jgi:hypothetical protein
MPDQISALDTPTDELPCDCIVYRAILRRNWVDKDTKRLSSAAFIRRPVDVDGLSVNIAGTCTPEQCMAQFRSCFGLATLHVGRVRDLGLDVVPDSPDHACITGVPYQHEDPAEAERIARLLAMQARNLVIT